MRYLCLIYLDEDEMAALPAEEMNRLNQGHLALNDDLRRHHWVIRVARLVAALPPCALRPHDPRSSIR